MDMQPQSEAPCDRDETPAERTARHLRMLRELAEIGMTLARKVGQAAEQAAEPKPADVEYVGPQPQTPTIWGLAFSRVSRVVHQSIALEARIEAGCGAAGPLRARAWPTERGADPRWREPHRTVFRAAGAANDRLADPETETRLDGARVEAVIAAIRGDLGIGADRSVGPENADEAPEPAASRTTWHPPPAGPDGAPDEHGGWSRRPASGLDPP